MEIVWLDITDPADLWRDHGFEVDDDGHCVVNGIEHRLGAALPDGQEGQGNGRGGIVGWGVSGIDPDGTIDQIDGIPTTVVPEQATRPSTPSHPNRVFRIDHLVIRTSDTPRTVAAFAAVGTQRRGGRTTNSAGDSVDMTFFWAGDTLLELAGPPTPKPDGGPARLGGIAYATDDLDATVSLLGDHSTTPVDAVQPGRRIAALNSAAGSAVPTAFMTPHVKR
ncbi:MAG: VOC family protein [Acidimicrobiales bacterium]